MTSTYITFRSYTQNIERTLTRISSSAQNSREAAYYEENIGKVKTLDEFLENTRLYNYALRAHGLTDMLNSQAFMRKVLESDLNDEQSFARGLIDSRFVAFARAFDFSTDGSVRINLQTVQTEAQGDETTELYSEHRVRRGERAATEVAYYQERIVALSNVEQFLVDDRLFSAALTSVGLEPNHASTATIRDVLTSDLNDPNSRANELGGAYLELRALFSFELDGSVAGGGTAQSQTQLDDTVYRYFEASDNGSSPAAAAFKTDLYESSIALVGSVDDFLADDKLFEYAITALGLDPILESKAGVRLVLTSDLSDPDSPANTLPDDRYRLLAEAFNFETDGSIAGGGPAQSAAQIEELTESYFENYDVKAEGDDTTATNYFLARINELNSVDELFNDINLYIYLLEAYGLDPKTESRNTIKRVLQSDISDPRSFANTRSDDRYRQLASAVNFDSDGSVATPYLAQLEREELATIRLYATRAGPEETAQAAAQEEAIYFHSAINGVANVDELLADTRAFTYVLTAYNLEELDLTDAEWKLVLTSDPFDDDSFASKQDDDRLRLFPAAFNFSADGSVARGPVQAVQTRRDLLTTADLFIRQAMETEAGEQNEAVRLALYFQRKAATIGNAFDILADKALIEVVRTALGFSESFSQADVDVQARTISDRLDFEDFQNPDKIERFIAQFAALYDVNNSNTGVSTASILFGNQSDLGFSESLIASLQNISLSR
jgi:Protein of unknown function (DUF1217)